MLASRLTAAWPLGSPRKRRSRATSSLIMLIVLQLLLYLVRKGTRLPNCYVDLSTSLMWLVFAYVTTCKAILRIVSHADFWQCLFSGFVWGSVLMFECRFLGILGLWASCFGASEVMIIDKNQWQCLR